MRMSVLFRVTVYMLIGGACWIPAAMSGTADNTELESTVRALVRANAEKDLPAMSRLMAHDADITSYSIGGRKYVGWPDLERDIKEEFSNVAALDLPISELKVWSKGDIGWYTMELDYVRVLGQGLDQQRAVMPLRETGVLERRNGQWVLLSWHESLRNANGVMPVDGWTETAAPRTVASSVDQPFVLDLSGEWDILEVEDNKRYKATLDKAGNGPYTQHGGRFVTTKFADRLWQGTWQQPGNDHEGEFELLLSEDGTQAKGVWWYSRVGTQKNIPPREHGGTYLWKRLTQPPTAQ
ncbi:MAG TPA: nuclear transport factor 2 family protein [Nitrospiraceae bacterium]|jgi:ketosteroid isomerase-like protein|nr:nuclear transport factor 2 family protein [Nitrospiraceae bacterium]